MKIPFREKTLNNLRLSDGAPGSGGISFQLELAGVMKLANQYPNCFYPIDKSIYNEILKWHHYCKLIVEN